MTNTIKAIIKASGQQICPSCDGEGEVGDFCGHESTARCYVCDGKGIISSNKMKSPEQLAKDLWWEMKCQFAGTKMNPNKIVLIPMCSEDFFLKAATKFFKELSEDSSCNPKEF